MEKIPDIFTICTDTHRSTNKVSKQLFSTQEKEEHQTAKPKS